VLWPTDSTVFSEKFRAGQFGEVQVVGQLQGWISNRANAFRDTVTRSTLPLDVKRMLHVVNLRGAWFSRQELRM